MCFLFLMDNEQNTKISIDIEKEPLLCYWAKRASKYGRGYLSKTIRLALEYYITHQSCLEIAKLHHPDEPYVTERQPLLDFRYGMSPIICSWIDTLQSVGISRVVAIRHVLLNSLSVISDDEAEFMINGGYVSEETAGEIGFEQLLAKTTAKLSETLNNERAMSSRSSGAADKRNASSAFFLSPGTKGTEDKH